MYQELRPQPNVLTQPQQNRRHFSQRPTWRRQPVISLGPADPGTVQPGVDVVSAQSLGLGHQLLVGGRAVENFSGEHGGAAQHLHVGWHLPGGGESAARPAAAPTVHFFCFLLLYSFSKRQEEPRRLFCSGKTCGWLCEQVSIRPTDANYPAGLIKKKKQTNREKTNSDKPSSGLYRHSNIGQICREVFKVLLPRRAGASSSRAHSPQRQRAKELTDTIWWRSVTQKILCLWSDGLSFYGHLLCPPRGGDTQANLAPCRDNTHAHWSCCCFLLHNRSVSPRVCKTDGLKL